MKARSRYWRLCGAGALILVTISYSPLVLSPDNPEPFLFGMPRTLWAGILCYLLIVLLIRIGTRVHPDNPEDSP